MTVSYWPNLPKPIAPNRPSVSTTISPWAWPPFSIHRPVLVTLGGRDDDQPSMPCRSAANRLHGGGVAQVGHQVDRGGVDHLGTGTPVCLHAVDDHQIRQIWVGQIRAMTDRKVRRPATIRATVNAITLARASRDICCSTRKKIGDQEQDRDGEDHRRAPQRTGCPPGTQGMSANRPRAHRHANIDRHRDRMTENQLPTQRLQRLDDRKASMKAISRRPSAGKGDAVEGRRASDPVRVPRHDPPCRACAPARRRAPHMFNPFGQPKAPILSMRSSVGRIRSYGSSSPAGASDVGAITKATPRQRTKKGAAGTAAGRSVICAPVRLRSRVRTFSVSGG